MGAALEIIIIPVLVTIAIIIFALLADFSFGSLLVAGVVGFLLMFGVVSLLRREKEWEGPPEDHESHDSPRRKA